MKFILLTQYYPPEMGAPQNRLSDLARRLTSAGHEVTVLTAMPNYPLGKVYPGYGGLVGRETKDGVKIIRSWIFPAQSASLLPRLLNYFSFALSSALVGAFLLRRADYLMVESPPLFLGLSGVFLSRVKRARLIFNVSDLWPESAVSLGVIDRDSFAFRVSSALERFCYRSAALVTGQSRSILKHIEERFPDVSTHLLSNGVDVRRFSGVGGEAAGEHVTFAYAGLHGLAQGLDQIVEAADRVRDEGRIRFVLVGDGPEKENLMVRARELGLGNVTFEDPVTSAEVPAVLEKASVMLVPLKSDIPGAVPSKLYEAMAGGRAVLLVAEGEAAEIVNRTQSGIAVRPQDPDSLVEAVLRLAADKALRDRLAENGRRAAEKYFDRESIARAFLERLGEPRAAGVPAAAHAGE